MNKYIRYKVWDEIIYPFRNLTGATVEVLEWIINFYSLYWRADYLSVLGLKLNRASKMFHMSLSSKKDYNYLCHH